ncbi:hypothetical protein GCM10023264_13430 [Sphingomonas daechungensis]|uniref:Uncharacterized protein n=1 Tax=Sphingomonas daechungensis TaxID=1176646 RepID=A0ABX6T0M2_9SPHN|nr:hypothetical protein [Sphingomonas daechungensis]QNP42278.1 hypothetical protein H9L15_07835 [Sphingomonas daechungensis]
MTTAQIVELAAAAAIFAGGVWMYRRPRGGDQYGSQGAVILFVIALLLVIHGLGLLNYQPSPAELGQ